ncbi:MAG: type II toxin-antitoxin system RelE/ParE family toxin [Proteobacteria bacterium]|nr:type II toxin-antitoxin system RelE/ParE family toxin [Pseudomonadota bacterium]
MVAVRWTGEARSDLEEVLADIERHNPMAAIDLVETIIASGNALATFPARNPVRHPGGVRERPVLGTRYVLVYRIERDGAVVILTVRHGARARRAP